MFGFLAGLLPSGAGAKLLGGAALAAGVAVVALFGWHALDTRDAALKAAAVETQQLDLARQANAQAAAALRRQQAQAAEASQAAADAAQEIGAAEVRIGDLRRQVAAGKGRPGYDAPAAPVLRDAVQGSFDAIGGKP